MNQEVLNTPILIGDSAEPTSRVASFGPAAFAIGGALLLATARMSFGGERFISVHLDCPPEICRQRDRTGAWTKADRGEIAQFPGVSADYEQPTGVDLKIPTHTETVAASVDRIIALLNSRQ